MEGRVPSVWFVSVLLVSLAGACAPFLEPAGPRVGDPALDGDHILTADGLKLPLRIWRPDGSPKVVVLALHGFNDYSKAFEEPAKFWAKRGILTYAYDQRGFGATPHHGVWPGVAAMTADMRAAARLIRKRHEGLPFVLLGESMGGAVIMAALDEAEPPPEADRVVLSAPAVWGWRVMPEWQRIGLKFLAHTIPVFTVTGQGFNRIPSDNKEMLKQLGKDPLVIKHTRLDTLYGLVNLMDRALGAAPRLNGNTLLLFGSKEDIIPAEARRIIEAQLPKGGCIRIAAYASGYHMLLRDLQANVVLGDIVAWIGDPAGPLPSGADREGRDIGEDRPVALKCGAPMAARP